jgi:hypothetical protein
MTRRRRVLRAAGALGAGGVTATSGCLGVLTGSEPARFASGTATIPQSTLDATGFEEFKIESVEVEREFSAAGQTRTVIVTNQLAQYDRAVEIPGVGRYRASQFTAFATPAVEILGRTFNPVAEMSSKELARQALDRFEKIEDLEQTGEEMIQILGTEATVGLFEATATITDGVSAEIVLHVAEAVRAGSDFVVGVGAYPKLLDQGDAIQTLFRAVEHTDETPSGTDSG